MPPPVAQFRKPTINKQGGDRFGKFKILTHMICNVCGADKQIGIQYLDLVGFPDTIDIRRTILKDHRRIGINCGCYARFHRQIAHIVDAQKRTTS